MKELKKEVSLWAWKFLEDFLDEEMLRTTRYWWEDKEEAEIITMIIKVIKTSSTTILCVLILPVSILYVQLKFSQNDMWEWNEMCFILQNEMRQYLYSQFEGEEMETEVACVSSDIH